MGDIELLIGLLAAVAGLVWAAGQVGVPYPVFLVLGGLGLGFVPGLPELELDPDVVFLVFIPPLVHSAAYRASPRQLRTDARRIGLAAVVLVAASIGAVAVTAHWLVEGLDWSAAFVLATVVAPTDLVAASAVFRRLGAPERAVGLVEGENLVNDATALTAWRIAVGAAAAGAFSLGDAAEQLVLVGGGGVLVGLAGGWVAAELRRRLDDPMIEITVSLLAPYVLYVAAEEAQVSGILAAVVSGLYVGFRDHEVTNPSTRIQAISFWNVLVFVLESMLFILVGLQLPGVVDQLGDRSVVGLALAGAALGAVLILVRLAYHFTALELDDLLERRLKPGGKPPTRRERLVVAWSGMRGAISLAVALAIPLETDAGAPFPDRPLIIFLTICVIGVTLVSQGLTLPAVIRALRFEERAPGTRRRAMVRFNTVQAALERIGQLAEDERIDPGAIERARSLYTDRAELLLGECKTGVAEEHTDTATWLRLRLELLRTERVRLIELRNRGEITNRTARAVQADLDLEVTRLERQLGSG